MIEPSSIGKRRMYIHTPGWHMFYFITFCFHTGIGWRRKRSGRGMPSGQRWGSVRRWGSGRRCRRLRWRCSVSFVPSACLQIFCCAILACHAAVRMIFINHCQVSFYCSFHMFMPCELKFSSFHCLDLGARFLD